jgi:hypothetical protein
MKPGIEEIVNKKYSRYQLFDAIQEGATIDTIREILGSYNDPIGSTFFYYIDLSTSLKDGMLSIHKALAFARSDIVELFLSVNPELAQIPFRDNPITHLALVLGGFESFREQCSACLNALLNNGAVVDAVDRLGRTVLHWAAFYNMAEMAKQLIDRGLNGMGTDYAQMTAVDVCIERDNMETLIVLVISFV